MKILFEVRVGTKESNIPFYRVESADPYTFIAYEKDENGEGEEAVGHTVMTFEGRKKAAEFAKVFSDFLVAKFTREGLHVVSVRSTLIHEMEVLNEYDCE